MESEQHKFQTPREHYYWLDWMRFTAATVVFLGHVCGLNWVEWGQIEATQKSPLLFVAFALTRLGFEAVIVFFVLSGYLVGGKTLQKTVQGNFQAGEFAWDRLTRVYVPLIPILLLSAGMMWFKGFGVSLGELSMNLLGLQGVFGGSFAGNAPLWSLSYETWFYVLAGCAAALASPGTGTGGVKTMAFLGFVLACLIFTKLDATLLLCWIIGAASFFLPNPTWRWLTLGWGMVLVAGGVAVSQLASEMLSANLAWLRPYLPPVRVGWVTMSAGLGLMVSVVSRWKPEGSWVSKLERVGSRLTAFSYTLYLSHYLVLVFWPSDGFQRYTSFTLESVAAFGTKAAVCLVLALALYWAFESRTAMVRKWRAG